MFYPKQPSSTFIKRAFAIILLCALMPLANVIRAEQELVASLETLNRGVLVKRAGTEEFVAVTQESLVGVGDTIQTDETGRARITFFANGVDTEVLPGSIFVIDAFEGSEDQFNISITLLLGQTTQRIERALDVGSRYTINSQGMEMAVRGTVFAVRVEPSGRSAIIVQRGAVAVAGKDAPANVPEAERVNQVPAGFGIRAEAAKGLSDVVKATTFGQLDAALDGCAAVINTEGDVVLNVRTGPGLNFPRIGTLENGTLQQIMGVTETTQWYRVRFNNWFAWIFAPALRLDTACPGLRRFQDDAAEEDITRYDPAVTPETITPTPSQ
jgi:Bacterial SH3 domain/FecR protein